MTPIIALITGSHDETCVLVQAFTDKQSILFRFSLVASNDNSLSSRIVRYFNDGDRDKASSTAFESIEKMRETVRDSVQAVWPHCAPQLPINAADVVVEINQDAERNIKWRICHEKCYQNFLASLRSISTAGGYSCEGLDSKPQCITLSALHLTYILGGRGGTTLARVRGYPQFTGKYVYKGLSFRLYLEFGDDYNNERETFYRELQAIASLPSHPNLISFPPVLVYAQPNRLCGSLYPFESGGSLQDQIDCACSTGIRISLYDKARWARDMSLAVAAIHAAGQYHMDVKPANMLLRDDSTVVLIDWERHGASPFFLAPEADGSWDVTGESRPMEYTKYKGPERQNSSTWPIWNVFPIWQAECLEAVTLAEVYSLGRALWVLIEQVASSDFATDRLTFQGKPTVWTEQSHDIPVHWKATVMSCVEQDPNSRATLEQISNFWETEVESLQGSKPKPLESEKEEGTLLQ